MRAGIAALMGAYVLSQFYRACLAVLTPVLGIELAATPADLAQASGYWFLAFAVMQLPIGWALDTVGPRVTASSLLAIGAAGAAVFATAQGVGQIKLAMILIGIGCAPVLMAAYYIFARTYSAAVFGTLAGITVGVGSLGNIAASLPLSAVVAEIGWRTTLWGLAAITLITSLTILALVRDPERVEGAKAGSVLDLLKMPLLWPILLMMAACYAPAAGLRGLWIGPYFADGFGADADRIGSISLLMGLAMVAGNFAYGPMDRLLGSRKWLVFGGNFLVLTSMIALYINADRPGSLTVALLCSIGFFGASFPMVMAHGRAFLPPALVGRGVTLINLFGIGSAGVIQFVTGRIYQGFGETAVPTAGFAAVFAFYCGLILLGLLVYLLSKDRTD